jgi:hypothetical protein
MTQKELQQKHVRENLLSTQRQVDSFTDKMNNIESEWVKYFNEISKHSNNFELKKIPTVKLFSTSVYQLDSNGHSNYNSERIQLGDTIVNYNNMEINYIGELPEGESNRNLGIYVEEHKTTPRRGWSDQSHGYKMVVKCDHEKNHTYYKTAKPVIKIIEDVVKSKWARRNDEIIKNELRNDAFREAYSRFPTSTIHFGGQTFEGVATNKHQIIVKNLNGSIAVLNYRRGYNDKVDFTISDVYFGKNNVDSVVEALGNMK